MNVQFIETGGSNTVLLCDNFLYTKRKTTHIDFDNETSYWYCRTRKCPGSLIIESKNIRSGSEHKTDCQQSEITVEKLLFYDKLKKLCRTHHDQTFVQVYMSLRNEFPNATQRIKFVSVRRSMFHWRYPDIEKLPKTMLELNELMKIPHYYNEFGILSIDASETDDNNELFAGTHSVDTISKKKAVKSFFMAFKNAPIINLLRGRVLKLGGDGTFSIRPRKSKGSKQYFDLAQQVYSVHVIIDRKFYTIATFVLQHSTADVMRKIFSLVNEWLNEDPDKPTTVASFMSDYECSSRKVIRDVWPNCKKLGCAVHFQRAIFKFGRSQGIYSDKTKVYERNLLAQVYGLCYLPERHMQVAYKQLEAQAVGSIEAFGKRLMEYLNTQWKGKNISVAEEDVRVNNGSEIFHWSAQRMHSWLKNNILDFMSFIRQIHSKSSLEFSQWLTIQTSKRQRQLEELHIKLQENLRVNVAVLGEEQAVRKFLSDSLNMTKRARSFFENLKLDILDDAIDYTDLFIQDKRTSAQHVTSVSSTKIDMTMDCSGIAQSMKLSTRSIRFPSPEPVSLGACDMNTVPQPDNLRFRCKMSQHHADFKLINQSIFMRDLGTTVGTIVNGIKFGSAGFVTDPLKINDGDVIQFGELTTVVHLTATEKNEHKNKKLPNTTAILNLTTEDLQLPQRIIPLSNTAKTVIGRCTATAPSSINNGLFNSKNIAYKHAELWYTDNSLFVKPIGPTYNVNVPLSQITRLNVPTILNLGQINSSKCFQLHMNSVEPQSKGNISSEAEAMEVGTYVCLICEDVEYQTNPQLQRHMQRYHSAPVPKDVIVYACPNCVDAEYETEEYLQKHIRRVHAPNTSPNA